MSLLSIPVQRIIIQYIFVDSDFYRYYLDMMNTTKTSLIDIKWLSDTFKPQFAIDIDEIVYLMKQTYKVDFLGYLFSKLKPNIRAKLPYKDLYRGFCYTGNKKCAQFFRKYYKPPDREEATHITSDVSQWNEDILSWICDDFNIDLKYLEDNPGIIYNICANGRPNIIKYLIERFGISFESLSSNCIQIIIYRDLGDVIKWIVKKFNPPRIYFTSPNIVESMYRFNSVDVFKYLSQEFKMTKDECVGKNCEYFNLTPEIGISYVAKFIMDKFSLSEDTPGMMPSLCQYLKNIDLESDKSWDEL